MALVGSKDLELGEALSQRNGLAAKSEGKGIKRILENHGLSEDAVIEEMSEDFRNCDKPAHKLKMSEIFLRLHGHLTSKDEKDSSEINIILNGDGANLGFFNPKREIQAPE